MNCQSRKEAIMSAVISIRQRDLREWVFIPFCALLPLVMACGSNGSSRPPATDGAADRTEAGTTLPDCKGPWPAAWVQKEQQLLAAINATRAQGGTCAGQALAPAPAATMDPQLTQISRCFARDQMLAGNAALAGTEANAALRDRVLASNFPGQLTGYAGDVVQASAADVLAWLLATTDAGIDYCDAIFNPTTNVAGIGYVEDPNGVVAQRWAGVTAVKVDGGTP
jgi:hypothetical protein